MNDERPIEKLLRRHAQKRRDESGSPLELHPAARRLLQGEVTRQFPPDRPAQRAGFWALLRLRWAYAVACVAVVGVGAFLLLPTLPEGNKAQPAFTAKESDMALAQAATRDDFSPPDALKKSLGEKIELAADAPVSAPAPVIALDATAIPETAAPAEPATRLSFTDKAARSLEPTAEFKSPRETPAPAVARAEVDRSMTLSAARPASAAPLPRALPPPEQPALAGAFTAPEAGKDLALTESRTASSRPARAPTAGVAGEARQRNGFVARGGGVEANTRATISQAFSNLAPLASADDKAKAAPSQPVLVNFRVEQIGDQWRVIDGDGSVYLGVAATAAVTDAAPRTEVARRAAPARAQTEAYFRSAGETAPSFLNHVEGTNRTLKQQVSFAWNFVAPSNVPSSALQEAAPPAPWMNSTINGQVQINPGTQFELNAVPARP